MNQPGRKYSNGSSYRYGFNGKENDNEVKGEGNQQDYGMRISDPRLGRFVSVDPLTNEYPELTPYQFASNTPIQAIDLDGLEAYLPNPSGNGGVATYNFFVWLFSDDVEEVCSGKDDMYDFFESRTTTSKDIRVYNEISHDKNSDVSIDEYDAVKNAEGTIKGITGAFKIIDGVTSIGAKLETIATLGLSAPSLIRSAEKTVGKILIKTETKLSTKLAVERKQITLNVPGANESTISEVQSTIKKVNRNGAQEKLKSLVKDSKASSADKGWVKQEINQINRQKKKSIKNPPGKVLAHERGREAAKGYSYKHSNLQTKELHKLQHKLDNNGKKNKERPITP